MGNVMNKASLTFTILLLFPSYVFAVCDQCAKMALDMATTTMEANIKATTTVVTSNGAAIAALNTLNTANSAALQLQLATLGQQELTALDGMATKVKFQLALTARESAINMDNLILNMEKIAKSEQDNVKINYVDRTFGPLSKPLSGRLNLPRTQYIERAFELKEVVQSNFVEGMMEWLNNPADESSILIEQAALLEDEDFFDITPFMQNKVLSPVELEKMKSLLHLLIEPKPKRDISIEEAQSSPAMLMRAIAQKQTKIKQQIIHSVITESVMDKAHLIITNDSWSSDYLSFDEDYNGMVSFSQFYEAETLGKVTSKEWYKDIARLTDTGLLREQIHQVNTTNMLLSEILKAERSEAKLVAIKALSGGGG
jgi:hypothetical protein